MEYDKGKMDAAAAEAAKEIPISGTAKEVADWWQKWFMTAGHKRLASILLAAFGHRQGRF